MRIPDGHWYSSVFNRYENINRHRAPSKHQANTVKKKKKFQHSWAWVLSYPSDCLAWKACVQVDSYHMISSVRPSCRRLASVCLSVRGGGAGPDRRSVPVTEVVQSAAGQAVQLELTRVSAASLQARQNAVGMPLERTCH